MKVVKIFNIRIYLEAFLYIYAPEFMKNKFQMFDYFILLFHIKKL